MSFRDKTRRRLRWFLIGVVAVVCLGGGAYVARNRQLDARARAGRDEGLKLLAAGDYFQALHHIGPYVQRHPNDSDTLWSYAQARQQVPEPDGRHLSDALSLYRRVLS